MVAFLNTENKQTPIQSDMKKSISNLLRIAAFALLFSSFYYLVGCSKNEVKPQPESVNQVESTNDVVFKIVQEHTNEITRHQVDSCLMVSSMKSNEDVCFDTVDLVSFFESWSETVPNITPSAFNWYNDAGGMQNPVDNLSQVNGVYFHSLQPYQLEDLEWTWYINGDSLYHGQEPTYEEFNIGCRGVVRYGMRVRHKPTKSTFFREFFAFQGLSADSIETCQCNGCPSFIDVQSIPFIPNVPAYTFMEDPGNDFNQNRKVDAGDLLYILSNFCR